MIVIANWKQNKTLGDLKEWISTLNSSLDKSILSNIEIVVAPSFPLITPFKMIAQEVGYLKLSSQDVSAFENGAHTGEVGASQLLGITDYAIIGHSERRKNGETVEAVNLKIDNALKASIKPIVCFSTEEEFSAITNKDVLFAYEPANAISTAANSSGPAPVEQVKDMVEKLKVKSVIYGGSIDENTIDNYLNQPFISGFLVGSASLDPTRFAKIVRKSS